MVEGNANEVSEEQFCEAVHLGFKEVRTLKYMYSRTPPSGHPSLKFDHL